MSELVPLWLSWPFLYGHQVAASALAFIGEGKLGSLSLSPPPRPFLSLSLIYRIKTSRNPASLAVLCFYLTDKNCVTWTPLAAWVTRNTSYISDIILLFFCTMFLSHTIIFSVFIMLAHIALDKFNHYVCPTVYRKLLIYLPVERHLGCILVLVSSRSWPWDKDVSASRLFRRWYR